MNKKLDEALNQISDQHLSEAENYKKPSRRPYWAMATAAILALIIGLGALGGWFTPAQPSLPVLQGGVEEVPEPSGIQRPDTWQLSNLVAAPAYPQMAQRPREDEYPDYKEYDKLLNIWSADQAFQYSQPQGYADSLDDFFRRSIPLFLKADENSACSPVNIYMALAMLAETTGGNSRQQILDVLGLSSIEDLRQQVRHLWNAHYCDDGVTTLLLGNSLWLDDAFAFHPEVTDRLAKNYYAASFHGDLGTDEMDQQLRAWLNANTGGLLQDQAENIELDPSTVFALASTVYFAADWDGGFSSKNTEDMLFHCENYDLMTPFMRKTLSFGTYYRGTNFGAVRLKLEGQNAMWLILPDEGCSVAQILESDEYLQLTTKGKCQQRGTYDIKLSLPKFDVISETQLADGLKELGITDVFHPSTSDFTPLTDTPDLCLGGATHAARVTIDEEGCLAAAFTVLQAYATSAPAKPKTMEFILDRPFLFVISSRDDLPLFVGTVAEP